ncbi:MAG TPA: hypothetical protein DGG95_15800, partial [Cytophagales bacterium]|nr:hypothetical protein [Cytophagales bacterium]
MKIVNLAFVFVLSISAHAQQLQKYYGDAMAAYRAKDYAKFYENIKEAYKIRPSHQGVLYQLGIAAALTNHPKEAIEALRKAILINADFKLYGLADFNSIKDSKDFKEILALQKEWQTPVINSEIAFVLKDRSLHSEGIEYDSRSKIFYVGSIHKRKIIKVLSDGSSTDFCAAGVNGMTSIFGIKIDPKKNLLWACASPMQEMENYDSTVHSAVFKFELSSGKLVSKYELQLSKTNVFGDLILNSKGQVFVSDSQGNSIFTVNEKSNLLEPFYSSPEFANIQGIAFSTDEKYLFIADYMKSIFRLNIKTKELIEITSDKVSLKGIDGLYFYNNSLIAIQNGVSPMRSTRYY